MRGIQAQVARQYGFQARYLPFCCYRHFTADELGRFAFESVGAGPVRLRAALPDGGMEIATPWTSF